jgi:hypothetical protein
MGGDGDDSIYGGDGDDSGVNNVNGQFWRGGLFGGSCSIPHSFSARYCSPSMETDLNLRPYGHVPPARPLGPLFAYDDPALAASRAEYKLKQWIEGQNTDQPIGAAVWWPALVAVCGFAELGFAIAFWWAMGTPGPMLLSGPLGIFLLVYSARTITRSRARTPLHCMREFVHCIERSDLNRAWKLLTPLDRDNYNRAAPSASRHDPLSVKRYAFDSATSFISYWRASKTLGPATRLKLRAGHELKRIHDDAALVQVEVHLQRSMRLQSETRALTITKLVLRHGQEWRVFDGEVAPSPELDATWALKLLAGAKT